MTDERPRERTRPCATGRPASTTRRFRKPEHLLGGPVRLAVLCAAGLLAISCGQGGSGGIVDVDYEATSAEVPSDPVPLDPETRTCWDGQPEVGCPNLPAPIDSVVEIAPGVFATYVDSAVSVESNPDYGSPLAVRFMATFDISNEAETRLSVPDFVRDQVVFRVEGSTRDLSWETPDGYDSGRYPSEGLWIEPGATGQVTARYGIATRGWDIAEPWSLGLARMSRLQVSLDAPAVDLGSASDSYAAGDISVTESASPDSPEAVVEAFHQAIAAWDVEAICAQLSSQAQVQFTGRLVAGDCPGVIRTVMDVGWGPRIQSRHAGAEVIEFWLGDEEIPEGETLFRSEINEDGIYAVVRPSDGPYDYVLYDFTRDAGGVKIDVYYPVRVV